MQVQKINNQTFTSETAVSKEKGGKRRANIDAAIALSDNDLKKFAYQKACIQTDEKKHNKLNKVIVLSLPVAAAVRDTLLTRGNPVQVLGKQIKSGPAARALTGAKTLGKWYGALAIATGVIAGADKLEKSSSKVKQFVKDQPFTAIAAQFVTALALCAGAEKVLPKLAKKITANPSSRILKTIEKRIADFDNNGIVKRVAKAYTDISAKIHPSLKYAGIAGLAFAPLILCGYGILHAFNHNSVRNRQAAENYTQLKTAQAVLAQARAAELEQN